MRHASHITFHRCDRFAKGGAPLSLHTVHEQVVPVSNPSPVSTKRKGVSVRCPKDGHQTHQKDALHHHAKNILATHQSTIEQG